jgi:hypothetical protein
MSVQHKLTGVRAPWLKRAPLTLFLSAILCALLAASRVPAQVGGGGTSNSTVKLSPGDKKKGFDLVPENVDVRDWPVVRLGFSIRREDKSRFNELTASGIKAYVDGHPNPVPVKAGDLVPMGNEPNNFLFMLDASLSMLPQDGASDPSSSINKLEAAKNALHTFIDRMRPGDKAAFSVFGPGPVPVAGLTGDRKALKDSVTNLKPQPGGTALYDSIQSAIKTAGAAGIRDIVVLSDGMDMTFVGTPGYYSSPGRDGFFPSRAEKQRRETEIVQAALSAGVRVFTLAIGDKEPSSQHFVDVSSLNTISRQANGKECHFIPLSELEKEASYDKDTFNRLVVGQLKDSLDLIQQSSRFTYSLTLDLRPLVKPGAGPQAVTVESTVGTTVLTWKQNLNWSANSDRPVPSSAEVTRKPLAPLPPEILTGRSLSQIYLGIFIALAVMAPLPLIGRRIAGRVRAHTEARRARNSVGVVGDGSPLIGENCPNESRSRRYTFKQGDVILRCPKCKTAHHLDCWITYQCSCMIHDCRYKMTVPEDVLSRYGFNEERELTPA